MSEKLLIPDAIFPQLQVVKARLETYPFTNGGQHILKECLTLIIRSIAGEVVDPGEYAHLGGPGAAKVAPGAAPPITVNGQRLTEGKEIAPGVVQYMPPAAEVAVAKPMPQSASELFAPVSGLFAPTAGREIVQPDSTNNSDAASRLPAPSDTIVEITSNTDEGQ